MYLPDIIQRDGKQAVNARDLYESLGLDKSQWARWYQKNIVDNEFAVEGVDYEVLDMMSSPLGGRPTRDFAVTLEFAKKISMLCRTEQGERVRQYFIECEAKYLEQSKVKALPQHTKAELYKLLLDQEIANEEQQATIQAQEQKLLEQAPKALFADAVVSSPDSILINQLAKILKQNGIDMGQNRLFTWLRDNGFLCTKGGLRNMPTQKSMDKALFEVKKTTIIAPDGENRVTCTPKVTGAGQLYFVNLFLAGKGAEYVN